MHNRMGRDAFRPALPWVLAASLPVAVQLVVLWTTGDRPRSLIVDVAELSDDVGIFTGVFSLLGIVLWFSGATGCWLATSVLRRDHALRTPLALLGLLSVVVGIDEALLIHESLPAPFGAPDLVWAVPAGVLALCIAVVHGRVLRPEWGLAVLAAMAFGVSVFVDVVFEAILESNASGVLFVEENAKLAGIFVWFGLCLHAARRAVGGRSDPGGEGRSSPHRGVSEGVPVSSSAAIWRVR